MGHTEVVFYRQEWPWVANSVTMRNRGRLAEEVAAGKDCLALLPPRLTVCGASRAARVLCAVHTG